LIYSVVKGGVGHGSEASMSLNVIRSNVGFAPIVLKKSAN
jgi:hypothetical protein